MVKPCIGEKQSKNLEKKKQQKTQISSRNTNWINTCTRKIGYKYHSSNNTNIAKFSYMRKQWMNISSSKKFSDIIKYYKFSDRLINSTIPGVRYTANVTSYKIKFYFWKLWDFLKKIQKSIIKRSKDTRPLEIEILAKKLGRDKVPFVVMCHIIYSQILHTSQCGTPWELMNNTNSTTLLRMKNLAVFHIFKCLGMWVWNPGVFILLSTADNIWHCFNLRDDRPMPNNASMNAP